MDSNRTISPSIAAFIVLIVGILVVGLYVSNIELESGSAGTVRVTQAPLGDTGQVDDETPSAEDELATPTEEEPTETVTETETEGAPAEEETATSTPAEGEEAAPTEEEPTEAVAETETEGAPAEEETATPASDEDEDAAPPTEEPEEAADTDEIDVEDIVGDSVTVEGATEEEIEEATEGEPRDEEDNDATDTEATADDEEATTEDDVAVEEDENRIQSTVSGLSVTVPESFEATAAGRFVTLSSETDATIELSIETPSAVAELLGIEEIPEEEPALNLLRQFAEVSDDAGEARSVSYGEFDGAAVNILREVGDGERRSVRIILLELPDGDLVFVNASADTVEFRDTLSDTLDTVLESLEVESGE